MCIKKDSRTDMIGNPFSRSTLSEQPPPGDTASYSWIPFNRSPRLVEALPSSL